MRGQGARVWDEVGREYLDCVTVATAWLIVGHCHPRMSWRPIREQSGKLITFAQRSFHNDVRARLHGKTDRYWRREGLNRAYLCNSGTESVEAALKLARLSDRASRALWPRMKGFHGRTMGALSATWEPHYRQALRCRSIPGFSSCAL